MSETKHTPGPWAYGGALFDARVMAKEAPPSWSTRTIAVVDHTEDEMGEANAHLIAAAPDMLEALEEMLAAHNISDLPTREEIDRLVRSEDAARDVIKKARGEK